MSNDNEMQILLLKFVEVITIEITKIKDIKQIDKKLFLIVNETQFTYEKNEKFIFQHIVDFIKALNFDHY